MTGGAPTKPDSIDPLADEILENLRGFPESGEIVLGGYFALKHYLDNRTTHDLDAWWKSGKSPQTMSRIREAMQAVAGRHGMALREREWGETASFELVKEGKKNPGLDLEQAKANANALRHLEALQQRRPLGEIDDPEERARARATREWIRRSLLASPPGN